MYENYKFIYKIFKLCILLFSNYNFAYNISSFLIVFLLQNYYFFIYDQIPSFNKISMLGEAFALSFGVSQHPRLRAWSLSSMQRERYLDCS